MSFGGINAGLIRPNTQVVLRQQLSQVGRAPLGGAVQNHGLSQQSQQQLFQLLIVMVAMLMMAKQGRQQQFAGPQFGGGMPYYGSGMPYMGNGGGGVGGCFPAQRFFPQQHGFFPMQRGGFPQFGRFAPQQRFFNPGFNGGTFPPSFNQGNPFAPQFNPGMMGSTGFGDALAQNAFSMARSMNKVGTCARGVRLALQNTGLKISGLTSAYQYANVLSNSSRFREVRVGANQLGRLPKGAIVVWGKTNVSPHGHISVALGNGMEASDHVSRQMTSLRGYQNARVFLPTDNRRFA